MGNDSGKSYEMTSEISQNALIIVNFAGFGRMTAATLRA
jgi:hypothetical protein